jgi:hypothetical protein
MPIGAAISSAADLIEEVMLLDVFPWGYKHRSCLGVDPVDEAFSVHDSGDIESALWL